MGSTREFSNARWHSRAGFLATTLLALTVMGAPFMVTRGLLEHGALFLPAVLGLMLLLGGPLVRVALATGRLSHRLTGREALHGVQLLVRLTLAIVLLVMAGRAIAWMLAETLFEVPARALEFRSREITVASTAWHLEPSQSFWAGLGVALVLIGVFWLMARRRRLAGLAWISGWVLVLVLVLLMLGLVVGYSLPGAGALAALAAPLRWTGPLALGFWGDAAAIALLGLGAQTAVVTAAGRGLPKRAHIGREARILVAGISFLTVLGGLVGLLLLCAYCVKIGIVPGVEHAAPGVLLLELVPALGRTLFFSWPEALQPGERQITLAWCFLVALACTLGSASLIVSRRLLPQPVRSRAALFGYAAMLPAAGAVLAGWLAGTGDAWLPLATVMPALLAVMHLTLARRGGTDLRVVSNAFHSSRPWLEKLNITFAFQITRPLLLIAVLAVALSRSEYGLVLAGFAVAFALMWVGSLRSRTRSRDTGLLRAVSTAALVAALSVPALAQGSVADSQAERAAQGEAPAVPAFEERYVRGDTVNISRLQTRAEALLAHARNPELPARQRTDALAGARLVLACLLIADAEGEESLRLERSLLQEDGLAPFSQLDEAINDHAAGNPERLLKLLTLVQSRQGGDALRTELAQNRELAWLLAATARDMRQSYGAGGREAQRLRMHLLQRATQSRTLLKPDPGPGVVYILTMLLAGFALAGALALGVGRGG
ncbi:MAG: hypothetical protein KF696_13340 [Planctomycetes bacterium]|nr:hypothetical protein [Planctomycetota bacterium]MCW8135542.1 hypothetical protein [Planctomycetota bacterium]